MYQQMHPTVIYCRAHAGNKMPNKIVHISVNFSCSFCQFKEGIVYACCSILSGTSLRNYCKSSRTSYYLMDENKHFIMETFLNTAFLYNQFVVQNYFPCSVAHRDSFILIRAQFMLDLHQDYFLFMAPLSLKQLFKNNKLVLLKKTQ